MTERKRQKAGRPAVGPEALRSRARLTWGVVGPRPAMPPWHERAMRDLLDSLRGRTIARRLWDEVFLAGEWGQLGGTFDRAYDEHGHVVLMWQRVRGGTVRQAAVEAARAVGFFPPGGSLVPDRGERLLRAFGESHGDDEAVVEAAVATGALVLVEHPRAVHWLGEAIRLPWDEWDRLWLILWRLARRSKAGKTTERDDVAGRNSRDPDYLTKLLSRLTREEGFPGTLEAVIARVSVGSYRLELPPGRIRVFDRGADDSLREWRP